MCRCDVHEHTATTEKSTTPIVPSQQYPTLIHHSHFLFTNFSAPHPQHLTSLHSIIMITRYCILYLPLFTSSSLRPSPTNTLIMVIYFGECKKISKHCFSSHRFPFHFFIFHIKITILRSYLPLLLFTSLLSPLLLLLPSSNQKH